MNQACADAVWRGEAVEVWTLPTAAIAEFTERLSAILDPGERTRAGRFRRQPDRMAFMAAHALARVMLSTFGPLAPADWIMTTNGAGKPCVRANPTAATLRFSLSRTPELIACALAGPHDVGIDVEDCTSAELLKLTHGTWLTAQEQGALSAQHEKLRGESILRLWTLKEAFTKAIGLGLYLPFDEIAFSLDPVRLTLPNGSQSDDWQFREFRPTPRHRLALAVLLSGKSRVVVRAREIDAYALAHAAGGGRSAMH